MISILNAILCVLTALAKYVELGIVLLINYAIIALAALWFLVVSNLPDMPDAPDWSGLPSQVFGIVNWLFPLGFLVETIAGLFILWFAWQLVSVLLRWAKFVE